MPDRQTILTIEIPHDVEQQEVWNIEARLRQVEGIMTELHEPKDLVAPTLLFIHLALPIMKDIAIVGGAIKATHEVAKIIYDFLHSGDKGKTSEQRKNKVVIRRKRKRIELYNLTVEEIEKLLEEG